MYIPDDEIDFKTSVDRAQKAKDDDRLMLSLVGLMFVLSLVALVPANIVGWQGVWLLPLVLCVTAMVVLSVTVLFGTIIRHWRDYRFYREVATIEDKKKPRFFERAATQQEDRTFMFASLAAVGTVIGFVGFSATHNWGSLQAVLVVALAILTSALFATYWYKRGDFEKKFWGNSDQGNQ